MRKKFIIFLLILSLCFFIFSIVSTYARYSSEYENTTSINLTKWKILINNSDISNNSDITTSITPILTDNPHIAEGVIVPTSTGYFDLEIDCSNTDLSFSYIIDINNTNSDVLDFNITGYSINNEETIDTTSEITGEVLYDENIDKISYRIFIEWNDSEENKTNNLEDTQLSINKSNATINVNVSLKQIVDDYNF